MQEQLDTRQLIIPWFDINTIDQTNFRYHLEQTPAQEAWLHEKLSELDRQYRDASDRCDEAKAQAFIAAKQNPYKRMTAKGEVRVDCSDEIAKQFSILDPEYQALQRTVNACREERDRFNGYVRAMSTKKAFLASLAGLTRAEMEMGNIG